MKKTLLTTIIIVATFLCFATVCCAEQQSNISVYIDGKIIDCSAYEQEPIIIDGSTLVPLRAIFEALGATVKWDQETKTITSELKNTKIILTINDKYMLKNGKYIELNVPAQIYNNRTLVPARAVSEAFGYKVIWHSNFKIVSIITNTNTTFATMYDTNYKEHSIEDFLVQEYKKIGWYDNPDEKIIMYASGGRKSKVSIANVEKYSSNGWYTEPLVWMYADNKKLEVPNALIEDYKMVGWYTLDEYISHLLHLGKYDKAVKFLNNDAYTSESEDTINKMLNKVYKHIGEPLVAYDWYISENSIGVPKANINLKNLTNKQIISFEIVFTCYDAYGDETYDYGSAKKTAFSDRDKIEPYSDFEKYLTLNGNERTNSISTPKVIRVAFSDGTYWEK